MNSVFGTAYAKAYDAFYQDKDYGQECDLIEAILRQYDSRPVRSILDLGCGTGGHALPLAERGYEIVGIDRSEDMLAELRAKTLGRKDIRVHAQPGNIRHLELDRRFDAALLMFAVLGYQIENDDVLGTLISARRHLEPGRLLIFDVWFGPAVLIVRPEDKIKTVSSENGEWTRKTSGSLDLLKQICKIRYLVSEIRNGTTVDGAEEEHRMRYFFPRELELLLDESGFQLIRIGAFPDFDRDSDETTWNVLVAARAV